MAHVSPTQVSPGDEISAASVNTPINQIASQINGNLDDTNISGISGSKVAAASLPPAALATDAGGGAWTAWTPSLSGWSGTPTVTARYKKIGKTVHCVISVAGTSNSATTTITLPSTSANDTRVFSNNDNGSLECIGVALVSANSNVLTSRRGQSGTTGEVWTAWAASGTKNIKGLCITYEEA